VPIDGPPVLPATEIDEQLTFGTARTALGPPIAATSNGTMFLGLYQRALSLVGGPAADQVVGQIVTAAPAVEAQEIGPFSGPPVRDGILTSGSAAGVATRSAPESMPADVAYRLQGVLLTESDATPVTLTEVRDGSYGGAVATDGTSFLVPWTTGTDASPGVRSELRAIRYAPGGAPEPAGGFVIADGAAEKILVGATFASGAYVVAWIEDGALYGARIATAGDDVVRTPLHPGPVVDAALATDGTQVLVVFSRDDVGGTSDVLGSFVTLD
jgi:hypothetical protein